MGFIGDGLNDCVALATASIGVAMQEFPIRNRVGVRVKVRVRVSVRVTVGVRVRFMVRRNVITLTHVRCVSDVCQMRVISLRGLWSAAML